MTRNEVIAAHLIGILRTGIPRYLQNGGCSNCGGVPHTSTCMVGALAKCLEDFGQPESAAPPAPQHDPECPFCGYFPGETEVPTATVEPPADLVAHLERQRAFSVRTFGPGARTAGVLDHIRKELREIEAEPADLSEWIDVVLLAFDGAWRAGHEPAAIAAALVALLTDVLDKASEAAVSDGAQSCEFDDVVIVHGHFDPRETWATDIIGGRQ